MGKKYSEDEARRKLKSGKDFIEYSEKQDEFEESRTCGSHTITRFANGTTIVFCGHGNQDAGKGLKAKWLKQMIAACIIVGVCVVCLMYYFPEMI